MGHYRTSVLTFLQKSATFLDMDTDSPIEPDDDSAIADPEVLSATRGQVAELSVDDDLDPDEVVRRVVQSSTPYQHKVLAAEYVRDMARSMRRQEQARIEAAARSEVTSVQDEWLEQKRLEKNAAAARNARERKERQRGMDVWNREFPQRLSEYLGKPVNVDSIEAAIAEAEELYVWRCVKNLDPDFGYRDFSSLVNVSGTSRSLCMGTYFKAEAAVREAMVKCVSNLTLTVELLQSEFALGNGTSVTWGAATVADHKQRIALLHQNIKGNAETVSLHIAALKALDEADAETLGEIAA